MVVRLTCSGKSAVSQPPQDHTTASASSRSPSTTTVSPSGVAWPRTTRAPCAAACAASVWIASWARSTPASGSNSTNSRSSPRKLGNSRPPSSTLSRSTGMFCARIVSSEAASQPSLRRANQASPHSISRSAPDSASSSRHSVRARRADSV